MYTGYKELTYSDEGMEVFYSDNTKVTEQFIENEYLLIKDESGKIVDKYCYQEGSFRKGRCWRLICCKIGVLK